MKKSKKNGLIVFDCTKFDSLHCADSGQLFFGHFCCVISQKTWICEKKEKKEREKKNPNNSAVQSSSAINMKCGGPL